MWNMELCVVNCRGIFERRKKWEHPYQGQFLNVFFLCMLKVVVIYDNIGIVCDLYMIWIQHWRDDMYECIGGDISIHIFDVKEY